MTAPFSTHLKEAFTTAAMLAGLSGTGLGIYQMWDAINENIKNTTAADCARTIETNGTCDKAGQKALLEMTQTKDQMISGFTWVLVGLATMQSSTSALWNRRKKSSLTP